MSNDYCEVKQQQQQQQVDDNNNTWDTSVEDEDAGYDLEESAVSSLYSSPSAAAEQRKQRHRRVHQRRNRGRRLPLHPDTEIGCFQYVLHTFSNVFHVVHLVAGLTLLGYSLAIFLNHRTSQQQQHWHIFPTVLTIWSILLLLAGSTGIHGLHSHICRRYGLTLTAYIGITIALFQSVLLLFYSIRKHAVLNYLRVREQHFYLSDKYIDAFDRHSTAFILTLLALALAEVLRFYMVRRLRSDLLLQDDAKRHLQRQNETRQQIRDQRRWKSTARSGDQNDTIESILPLLAQDHSDDDDDDDDDEYREDPPGAKEPTTTGIFEEYDMDDGDTQNGKAHTNANSGHTSTSWWDEGGVSSSDDFAPIEEDLTVGVMAWNNQKNNTTAIPGKGPVATDDGPDLSWAQQGNHD